MKLCQETLRPLAGELKLQAVPSTRTTPEESDRYQQQPQTVSLTLGKTSLEINELALRARRPIAIAGPRCRATARAFHLRRLQLQEDPNGVNEAGCYSGLGKPFPKELNLRLIFTL